VPHRKEVFHRGGYYHVHNRGADRGLLFFAPDNYEHCLRLIKRCQTRYGAAVIAYCLMPNHYHFLLRQDSETPLSRFVNVVFNAYVQAVNRQEGRSGTLFEGRFRHVEIDREAYLIHLCRYIHLNPVKAGLVQKPEDWPYSNYRDWMGLRYGTLRDQAFIREFVGNAEDYEALVNDEMQDMRFRDELRCYAWD